MSENSGVRLHKFHCTIKLQYNTIFSPRRKATGQNIGVTMGVIWTYDFPFDFGKNWTHSRKYYQMHCFANYYFDLIIVMICFYLKSTSLLLTFSFQRKLTSDQILKMSQCCLVSIIMWNIIVHSVVITSMLTWFISYFYYWNLQFLNNYY